MRLLTQKDGDVSSYFNRVNERVAGISDSTLKHMLIDSHTNDDNKCRIRANFPLEHIFGFCKSFKKHNKRLGI